jgi:FADH2-dependent halogenase
MSARRPLDADVLIVGGGPAASASALHLLRLGIQPLIVERERFPRYHIGESLTGECGNCLRELGLEDLLSQRGYPIKLGVTVWGAGGKNSFWVPVKKRNAQGALEEATTWQVRRAEFDQDLLQAACDRGALHLEASADKPLSENGRITGISAALPSGETRDLQARVVLDASGQATFLASHGVTGPKSRGRYNRQVASFTQVKGARRDPGPAGGNTLIFYREKHHWAWFIPLDEEVTSVGVVAPAAHWQASGPSKEEALRRELETLNPELSQRVAGAEFVEEVRTASNYSYHIERFTGPGFLCVGDAHRFLDPIFSFGVFFAMQEAKMAAAAVQASFAGEAGAFSAFEEKADRGQRVVQNLIDCFWDYPLAFQRMAHQTHTDDIIDCFAGRLYAAEDSLSEGVQIMRRLAERPHEDALS